jgi:AAA domain
MGERDINHTHRVESLDADRAFHDGAKPSNAGEAPARKKPNGAGGVTPPDEIDIPADTLRVIREGDDDKRSNVFWNCVLVLHRLDFTVDDAVALFEKYPTGIAKKYRGRLRAQVEGVYARLNAPWPSGDGGPPNQPRLALRFGRDALAPQSTGAIVKGILHAGSLTLIYGPPKSGKSFVTTDLLTSVACLDSDWFGHKIVKHGHVLYVTCEGHAGFWKRLHALSLHRWDNLNGFPDQFILGTGRPTLIGLDRKTNAVFPHSDDITIKLEELAAVGIFPIVVAVDTVFRSFGPGNVNASDHMNAYIAAVTEIADRGIAVALVHHATKSASTPAGSVTLIGAADTIISTKNGADDASHTWEVEAAKDDMQTPPRRFRLDVVQIGLDPDGEEASSCVVVDLHETAQKQTVGRPRNTAERDLLMDFLHRTLDDFGHKPNGGHGVPRSVSRVVEVGRWREEWMRRGRPGDDPDTKRKAFKRMVRELIGINKVAASNDLVWPVFVRTK